MSEEVQTFRPTNGRVIGVLGLAPVRRRGRAVRGVRLRPRRGPRACWRARSRASSCGARCFAPASPRRPTDLRIRTLSESVSIPLAGIDTIVVRRYLLVRAGGKKYICPAISRPLRKTVRTELKWKGSPQLLSPGLQMNDTFSSLETQDPKTGHEIAYPDFVETQISTLADTARARRGIAPRSEQEYELGSQVVRRRAWPEIGGLAVLGAAFVVALLVV